MLSSNTILLSLHTESHLSTPKSRTSSCDP
jgi:hypothetical protein